MNRPLTQLFFRRVSVVNFLEFARKIIYSTCLVFTWDDGSGKAKISKVRLLVAICLSLLMFYQTINTIIYTVWDAEEQIVTAIMFSCWTTQSFFSVCFLVYWQFKGHLHQLLNRIKWSQFQASNLKSAFSLKILYVGFFASMIPNPVVTSIITYSYYSDNLLVVNLKPSYYQYYGGHRFAFLTSIVLSYALYVWLVVITLYCVISWIVYKEIESLNLSVKKIGTSTIGESDKSVVADKLLDLYDRQIMLSVIIEEVNSIFESYAFLMLATNLPTTIFSLMSFIQRLKLANYSSTLFMMPAVVFCILEIIALTHSPSKIYSSILSIEKSIFTGRVFWFPYDQKLYEISRVFVCHVNQSNLGLSLWGFTLINKTLILTTASLTVTYLILLLEMGKTEGNSNGNFTYNCTN